MAAEIERFSLGEWSAAKRSCAQNASNVFANRLSCNPAGSIVIGWWSLCWMRPTSFCIPGRSPTPAPVISHQGVPCGAAGREAATRGAPGFRRRRKGRQDFPGRPSLTLFLAARFWPGALSISPRRIKASVPPDLGQQQSGLPQQNPTSGDSRTGFADQTLRASAGLEKTFQVELDAMRAQIIHDAEHRGKPHVPISRQTAPALP